MNLNERIAHSMALLDRLDADWPSKVNLDTLAIADPKLCVAGQTVGFSMVCDVIGNEHDDWLSAVSEYYAFAASLSEDYDALDAAWRTAIRERINA